MHRNSTQFFILIVLSAWILTACGQTSTTAASTATLAAEETVSAPTTAPSPSPIPAPTRVWFVSGSLSSTEAAEYGKQVSDLASAAGMQYEQQAALDPNLLAENAAALKAVVIFGPDPGLNNLITQYPAIQFISVGIPNLTAAANLYQVAPTGLHPEWTGYLAGYIAAVLTDEWRIGMLTEANTENGNLAGNGFINGGVMFCGLCNPQYPPYSDYPLMQQMTPGAADWQAQVDALLNQTVNTVYIYPSIATPELLQYMAGKNVRIITSTPPESGIESAWLAVVQIDLATPLKTAVSDALAGTSPGAYQASVQVTPVDETLLSPGKMEWLNTVITDLTNGNLIP